MKNRKLDQILSAARREPLPDVPAGFAERVMQDIATTTPPSSRVLGFWDQLNHRAGRYAAIAAATIAISGAIELSQHFGQDASIDDDIEQIYSDWTAR